MDFDKNKSIKGFIWHYFNIHRADSGWLRLFIAILFIIVAIFVFRYAYLLILKGVEGEFELVVQNFKGVGLYLASVSPGVLFVVAGTVILACGLPSTLRALIKKEKE